MLVAVEFVRVVDVVAAVSELESADFELVAAAVDSLGAVGTCSFAGPSLSLSTDPELPSAAAASAPSDAEEGHSIAAAAGESTGRVVVVSNSLKPAGRFLGNSRGSWPAASKEKLTFPLSHAVVHHSADAVRPSFLDLAVHRRAVG